MNYNIRKAQGEDVLVIIKLLANDSLGKQRESHQEPLLESYYLAFTEIDNDKNNYLMVLENNNKIIGTFQLTIITYLTYQGGESADKLKAFVSMSNIEVKVLVRL